VYRKEIYKYTQTLNFVQLSTLDLTFGFKRGWDRRTDRQGSIATRRLDIGLSVSLLSKMRILSHRLPLSPTILLFAF